MKNPVPAVLIGAVLVFSSGSLLSGPAAYLQEPPVLQAKPDFAKIIRDYVLVKNKRETGKLPAFFTDDAEIAIDGMAFRGRDALAGLFDFDAVNEFQLDILELRAEETRVVLRVAETSAAYRLLGLPAAVTTMTVAFRDGMIERIAVASTPESQERYRAKFEPFATWTAERHPEEFSRLVTGGYDGENAKLFLALLRDWREKS